MKQHIPLLLILLAAVPGFGFTEEIACKSVKQFADGSSSGNSATLTLANGRIVGLDVESFNASGQEGGGYVCSLDTDDVDSKSNWSVSGDISTLEIVTMGEKSALSRFVWKSVIWPSGRLV